MKNNRTLLVVDLGFIEYKEAWELQKEIADLRYKNSIADVLLLLEHPHTYTLGKTADKKNLISSKSYLEENNISIFDIDRGGDITYHGPGQLVGYPIISLTDWQQDTHKYLRAIEQAIMDVCLNYELKPGRISEYTGVWIDKRKIAAIGIKVSRWITMHGFAFNVNTDLKLFKGIIPCGIEDKDKDVTSLQRELNRFVDISEVKQRFIEKFAVIFNYDKIDKVNIKDLLSVF